MTILKRFLFTILLALVVLAAGAKVYNVSTIPNVHLSDSTRYLSNPDGIIPDNMARRIDALLADIHRKSSAEVAVVVVGDIASDDENRFATALFSAWGIGKKDIDNGVLVLVAKDSRRAVIRTGYGTEGLLPDIICGRILRNQMIPHFKNNAYGKGVLEGVTEIHRLTTTPGAIEELKSSMADDDDDLSLKISLIWCWANAALFAACLLLMLFIGLKTRIGLTIGQRERWYRRIDRLEWAAIIIGLFIAAIPALAVCVATTCMLAGSRLFCPQCGKRMRRLSHGQMPPHLSESEQTEHRLRSRKFKIWACDSCGFVKKEDTPQNNYVQCPNCKTRAYRYLHPVVLTQSTPDACGTVGQWGACEHCGCRRKSRKTYLIAKTNRRPVGAEYIPASMKLSAAGKLIYRQSSGRPDGCLDDDHYSRDTGFWFGGGRGSGGGSFGGSFGGGRTGGGGASARW